MAKASWQWIVLATTAILASAVAPAALASAEDPPQPPSADSRLVVTIEPDKLVWGYHQTISGTIKFKNEGREPVRISVLIGRFVSVSDPAGDSPRSFSILGNIDPGPHEKTFDDIEPGATLDRRFHIHTDRLFHMENGYFLKPGQWRLSLARWELDQLHTDVKQVEIEVRAAADEYTGPRIIEARAVGSRLVLFREDSLAEVVEPTTGAVLGVSRPGGWVLDGTFRLPPPIISPDARICVSDDGRGKPQAIDALYGDPPPVRLDPPKDLELGSGGFRVTGFSPDGSAAFGQTNFWVVTLDTSSGRELSRAKVFALWPLLSADGRFAVAYDRTRMQIGHLRGSDEYHIQVGKLDKPEEVRDVKITGRGEVPNIRVGIAGVYLWDMFSPSVLYLPLEAGEPRAINTSHAEIINESSDGELVLTTAPASEPGIVRRGRATVEVWSVATGVSVSSVTREYPITGVLISSPARVIVFREKWPDGDAWSISPWLDEHAEMFDARTGVKTADLDLTPKPGSLPSAPQPKP